MSSDLLKELSECPTEGARMPAEVGVVVYVSVAGEVKSAGFTSVGGEDPVSATWAECAQQKILGWTLSDPRGTVRKLKGSVKLR